MKNVLIGFVTLMSLSAYADISGVYVQESGHMVCPNEIELTPGINLNSVLIKEYFIMGDTREITHYLETGEQRKNKDIFKVRITPKKIESNHFKRKLLGFKSELYSSLILEEFKTVQGENKLKRTTYVSGDTATHLSECIYVKF